MIKNLARVNKGLAFIQSQQQSSGSFVSFSSPNINSYKKAKAYKTTFFPSLILLALQEVSLDKSYKIRKNVADFLLSQKNPYWSYNYWERESKEVSTLPYPDDLDDTFCALSGLYQQNAKLINGEVLAKIVLLLTSTEKKEGGPYRTWLVAKGAAKHWYDVDFVVNVNVAFFLHLQDITLPNLTKFIDDKLKKWELESPYYPSIIPGIYFLSRFYNGFYKRKVISFLFSQLKRKQSSLTLSLLCTSLLRLGKKWQELTPYITKLQKKQAKNGSWEPYGFCIDPSMNKKKFFAASASLTTAFCLEAISVYAKKVEESNKQKNYFDHKKSQTLNLEVLAFTQKKFSALSENLRESSLLSLEQIRKRDTDFQISLMPFYFYKSLHKQEIKIKKSELISLGYANICGWIAYTIYDDFLDGEGNTKFLSVANMALRELTVTFTTIGINKDFLGLFTEIMNKIDEANTWEMSHCRMIKYGNVLMTKGFIVPDFGNLDKLAERSLGHALTPLALLSILGYSATSQEVTALLKFFTHYIIARQLNDDAHDFEKDFLQGQVNAIVADLMVETKKHWQKKSTIDPKELLPIFQETFWNKTVLKTSQAILSHVKIAQEALVECLCISNSVDLLKLLDTPKNAALRAIEEQKKAKEFLLAYKPS